MVGCVNALTLLLLWVLTCVVFVCVIYSIHERSAREKISSDQVAHVLNDEVSRKYIQSLKRYVVTHFTSAHAALGID